MTDRDGDRDSAITVRQKTSDRVLRLVVLGTQGEGLIAEYKNEGADLPSVARLELAKLGVVVHDTDNRQWWRATARFLPSESPE
ncbi:CysS/YqeB C-terminal domain-containing protein [Streptomyces laurentii]|uniref:CysS/YqeB C-terminal domain-containing protein n=1 Tax=Streptomyces laurentii TaxID=39478 RepID=UPI0036CBE86E